MLLEEFTAFKEADIFPTDKGVYCIFFIDKPDYFYVGSACGEFGFKGRWKVHLRQLYNGSHCNRNMLHHFKKYSSDNIRFLVLEKTNSSILERETFWISALDTVTNGMNCNQVAGSMLGFKHSSQTKNKVSSTKFQKLLDNYENIVCELYIVHGFTIKKISEKLKLSKTPIHNILFYNGIDTRANINKERIKRSVYQYDKEGNLIREYSSIFQASQNTKIAHSKILAALKGKTKFSGGFIWSMLFFKDKTELLHVNNLITRKPVKLTEEQRKVKKELAVLHKNATKYRNIKQLNLDGTYIKTWNTVTEIVEYFNCNRSQIIRVITGKRSKFRGFRWSL